MDRLTGRNDEDLSELLATGHQNGLANMDVFESFAALRSYKNSNFKETSHYHVLLEATKSEDWQRANIANLFLAQYYAQENNSLAAIAHAQNALTRIPTGRYDLHILDALYDTYDILSTVFLYDHNVAKSVEASQFLIKYGQEAGRKIDAVGIVFNLSGVFAQSRDYETATQLSELLVQSSNSGSRYEQALANLGHGKNLVSMGQHKKAIPFLKTASQLSPNSLIDTSAKAKLALCYAHTGQILNAQKLVQVLKKIREKQPALSDKLTPMIREINIEIAAQEGDYDRAYALQKNWAADQIEKLEALADTDRRSASNQLALNEQVAQAQFENLQETTKLQAEVIKRGKNFGLVLSALLVALALIICMLIAARRKQIEVHQQLEIASERAQAGEQAKARFLAVISHELRTPMNPIMALSRLLLDKVQAPENRKLLTLILLSAENLMIMIENMVSVADNTESKTGPRLETFDLRGFLTDIVRRFYCEAAQKNLQFEMRVDRGVADMIKTNKTALRLAFANVLSNAVKFTHKGFISVRIIQDPDHKDRVIIKIQDSGIGMDEAEIPILLTAFEQRDSSFTREFGGAGIGLYVARKHATSIGANMTIESQPSCGTAVTFNVPGLLISPVALAA